MKNSFVSAVLVAATLTLSFASLPVEAARLGGGKSFGMSRNTSSMSSPGAPAPKPASPTQNAAPAPSTPPMAAPAPAPAPARSGMSRWLGPIAGLAAGIGLAAMLSHFGMGEGVANFLMIALLAFAAIALVKFLFRRAAPAPQPQYAGVGTGTVSHVEPVKVSAGETASSGVTSPEPAAAATSGGRIPADFDVAGFVRQAKLNFVRLQAANDRGDMADIREFVAPEIFAEIQLQYEERGRKAQQTDVVRLDAELLDVEESAARYVASVRFHGQVREEADAPPQDFSEIWHLSKPANGSRGWLVAGIQQG